MTFPTTSLLDDFTRGDEDPLAGNWRGPAFAVTNPLILSANTAMEAGDDTPGSSYWRTKFSGAIEVWGTIVNIDNEPSLIACLQDPTEEAASGYVLGVNGLEIQLIGPSGDLATYTPDGLGDGSSFGLSVAGGVLSSYHKPSGGSWTLLGTVDDTSLSSGYIGAYFAGPQDGASPGSFGFTAFGGGGVVDAQPVTARGLYLQLCQLDGTPWEEASNARPLPVSTVSEPQVTIPISDSRTGQIAVSMQERIAAALPANAAKCVMKVLYINPKGDQVLLINGIVTNPESDFDAETITCQLHDSSIRLKRRYLGYNHASIILSDGQFALNATGTSYSEAILDAAGLGDFLNVQSTYGIPIDGKGLRMLLLDASHGAADWEGWPYPTSDPFSSVPAMGIRYQPGYSVDDANRQPVYDDNGVPPVGITGIKATVADGSPDLTSVDFSDAFFNDGRAGTPTIADVPQYAALSGPGIPDFAIVSSASGTTIVMSENATADHTAAQVDVEDAIYAQLNRGDCVYDDFGDIVQAQGGLECDFVPVDAVHTGPSSATWVPGQLCELYTANRVGVDRSQGNPAGNVPVVFVHGLGGFHLTHSPDADSLITYEVQVQPGGQDSPGDTNAAVTLESDTVPDYGFWEDWEQATSAGTGDNAVSASVLEDRAKAMLVAYQNVPDFVTGTIDTDQVDAYCFGTDFFLGDTVTVYGKRGYCTVGPLAARITQVEISQVDTNGNCQLALTMVLYLTTDVSPEEEAS